MQITQEALLDTQIAIYVDVAEHDFEGDPFHVFDEYTGVHKQSINTAIGERGREIIFLMRERHRNEPSYGVYLNAVYV